MNKIFLEEIEKAWFYMEGVFYKGIEKKALFIFAKLSDNFLLNPVGNYKKKIKKRKNNKTYGGRYIYCSYD